MSLEMIKEITLDCNDLDSMPKLKFKQGNNLYNIILIDIKHNNQLLKLDGITAKYVISRANGSQNLSDAIIQDNKIKIILSDSDLACAGNCSCEVILSKDDTVVYTSSFYIKVLPSVLDESRLNSSDEYSSIINVINEANKSINIINELEKEILNNESLRITKETIRNENESQRQQSELERQNKFNEIKSQSNQILQENKIQTELAKKEAQNAKTQADYAKTQADKIANANVEGLIDDINDIKSFIGYTESDIFGVEVDFENKTITRLAGAVNLTEGESFNNINAFNRRRCILSDSGKVVAYSGDEEFVEDGSVGQVMVEQPKFYYKVVPIKLEPIKDSNCYHLRKARYYICDTQKLDFKLHPAFIQNGVEKEKIYLSAYEGNIYDVSESVYLMNDEQVADFDTDKLSSIINTKPCSGLSQNLTRANSRKLANNRGAGWNISTIQAISATQLLFLIEYASFNMQEKIGVGVSNKTDSGNFNIAENTGHTSSLANSTGSVENNSFSYRGEENFYANIWKWVDGINIYNNQKGLVYVSDNNFSDNNLSAPYINTNITICDTDGYISSFGYNEIYDWIFIPSETLGNSNIPVGDYCFQRKSKDSITVCELGGRWSNQSMCGGFTYNIRDDETYKARTNGCRLLYIPQEI